MLYYNNNRHKLLSDASKDNNFDDLIVHNRCRKTDTINFNHFDGKSYMFSRCLYINDILGYTNSKDYLIKNYYKNLF